MDDALGRAFMTLAAGGRAGFTAQQIGQRQAQRAAHPDLQRCAAADTLPLERLATLPRSRQCHGASPAERGCETGGAKLLRLSNIPLADTSRWERRRRQTDRCGLRTSS